MPGCAPRGRPSCATVTPCSSMSVTRAGPRPRRRAAELLRRRARQRPAGTSAGSRSSASTSRMRASGGSIAAEVALRSVSLAISPSAPASSTPVGPPPTTTNVIHSRRPRVAPRARPPRTRTGSGGGSRARPRCVFRPGANGSHSSWPKYAWRAPVATIEGVVGDRSAVGQQDLRARRGRGRPPRRAGRSCCGCLRRIDRSGWAMSAGDRAPVATW